MVLTKNNLFICLVFAIGFSVGILTYHSINKGSLHVSTQVLAEPQVAEKVDKGLGQITKQPRRVPTIDEDWGKVQCTMDELSIDYTNLQDYLSTVTLPCTFMNSVGGSFKGKYFHGEKWVCIDPKFNIKQNKCTVLSFGISTDWTFDDEIDELYGCKVYAFDPTIAQMDHNRSANIMFFNLGISNGPRKFMFGKVDSYSNILKFLHLENAIIDYLKMDVEGSEYPFFQDVFANTPNLLKNVKQIGMEVHISGKEIESWNYFQRLDCLGFKIMSFNYNPVYPGRIINGKRRATLYEIVWARDQKWP